MEVVTCYCLKCKSELGRFQNAWIGLGNTYFSPAYPSLSRIVGLKATGDVHEGAPGSQIELRYDDAPGLWKTKAEELNGSFLQDLACLKCGTLLGLQCDSAPEGHLLKENQLILRLAEMSVMSEGLGRQAKISVLKTFSLTKEKAKRSQSRRASTAQPIVRPKPAHIQAASRRTPSVKTRPSLPPLPRQPEPPKPVAEETFPLSELASLKSWTEKAITCQKRDIDRISGTVERIEKGMQSFREFMEEVRTELASNRQVQNHASEEDLVLVRKALDGLRLQIESGRAGTKSSSTQNAELSSQKLEIIVRNLQRVSAKANEVDDLKMEIEQLKARLHQTEDVAQTGIPPSEVMQSIEAGSGPTLKRKRNQIDDENNSGHYDMSPELPAKRQRIPNSIVSAIENSAALQGVSAREDPDFPLTSSDNYEILDMPPPTSNKRLVIEITSSRPDISRSRVSQYDERGKFVYEEEDIDDNYRPNFPKNKLISSVSALSRPRRRASSTVMPNTPISASTSSPRALRSSVAPESHSNIKIDLCTGKFRDQTGALITPEGKIDGRSLRYKKQPLRELDSNAPANPGPASPPKDTARPSDTRVSSSPTFVKPMLPPHRARQNVTTPASETRGRSSSVISMSMSMPPPLGCSSSTEPSSTQPHPKPFQCGGCGVRCRAIGGLEYHKENSSSPSCKSTEKDEIPTEFKCSDCGKRWKTVGQYEQHPCQRNLDKEDREAMLAARERLVRATLEREMMGDHC